MTVLRTLLILVLSFAISACDRVKYLCQADIGKQLLYPDSAEFDAFEPISRQEYENQATDILNGKSRLVSPELRAIHRQMTHEAVRAAAQAMTEKGTTFYTYRMRARDRRGNILTANQVCMTSKEECACLGGEPEIERPPA